MILKISFLMFSINIISILFSHEKHRECPVVPPDVLSTYENDQVLKVLLNCEKLQRGCISSRQPVKVQKNQSFIVDL